jgi:N-acetylglucosamine kinase-like BadF-type ATPase
MKRVLGVDGGQSGIRLRHSAGNRIVEVEGVSRLEGDTVAAVADTVARGWRDAGFEPVDLVMMGLTTAPADAAHGDRLCRLVSETTGAPEVWLADDAVTSHAGALSLGWGVSLVAGTGVACLALPADGGPRIFGGHGYLLGDEGGAFWIGRRGLRAVLLAAEGRGPETSLADASARRFGPSADLHVRLHEIERPVNTIAQFAPEVLAAAETGDAVAGAIVDEAAAELLLIARAGARWAAGTRRAAGAMRATGGGTTPVPLALGGRLLAQGSALRLRLDALIAGEGVTISARTADASALEGAVRLGLAGDPGPYLNLIHAWTQGAPA